MKKKFTAKKNKEKSEIFTIFIFLINFIMTENREEIPKKIKNNMKKPLLLF